MHLSESCLLFPLQLNEIWRNLLAAGFKGQQGSAGNCRQCFWEWGLAFAITEKLELTSSFAGLII